MRDVVVLMKKQNRTLVIVFVFVLGLMVVVLKQGGILKPGENSVAIEVNDPSKAGGADPAQESLGDPVQEHSESNALRGDEERIFSLIVTDLNNCFEFKNFTLPPSLPVTIESILNSVQSELGPAANQADRWMNWHLKNKEGVERRVRLEITEGDEGKIVRELKYFAVDKEGLPVPMNLPPEKKDNPTDETLNSMLKEGDVFYKEKAAYAVFSGGARVEFVEKNGQLSELEFQKGDRYFRCQNLKLRDSCQCVR
jgi:hypothetical protein